MTLFEAVAAGNAAAVTKSLEAGEDVNQLGPEDRTPLIEAAAQGNAALVKVLLDAGAEPICKDQSQDTALLKAAANGHIDAAVMLAPFADDDERDMARAFLSAHGDTHGPEAEMEDTLLGRFKRRAAEYTVRASDFVGHAAPGQRMGRVLRSEVNVGKKDPFK